MKRIAAVGALLLSIGATVTNAQQMSSQELVKAMTDCSTRAYVVSSSISARDQNRPPKEMLEYFREEMARRKEEYRVPEKELKKLINMAYFDQKFRGMSSKDVAEITQAYCQNPRNFLPNPSAKQTPLR